MFHNVVWQHMQGVVGVLIKKFTANLPKKCENRLTFDITIAMSLWSHLRGSPCKLHKIQQNLQHGF